MISCFAILNGALELLPETLATMAIIPLQMKAWSIASGKSTALELDRRPHQEIPCRRRGRSWFPDGGRFAP